MSSATNHSSLSSSPSRPPNGVGPCPKTLKSILRRKLCYQHAASSTSSLDSTVSCRSVSFKDDVDEHPADEWDRSSCAVACPTSRDIWELKQIQRELLPSGCGVIKDQYADDPEPEYFFDIFGDDDVDCSQRRQSYRRPPARPKHLLNKIPIELCPILPASAPLLSTPMTPNNSMTPSPLDSPPHGSPVLAPVKREEAAKNKRGGPMMTILPILPPEEVAASSTNTSDPDTIPTPPDTPTLPGAVLPATENKPKFQFMPVGPAPVTMAVTAKEAPHIKVSPTSSSSPPSVSSLSLLPVLPQRTPPPRSMTSGPPLSYSGGRTPPPLPSVMKTCSTGAATAPGFVPFTMSFKAAGRT